MGKEVGENRRLKHRNADDRMRNLIKAAFNVRGYGGMKNERYEKVEEMGGDFLLLFCGAGGGRKPDSAGGNAGYDKI